MTGFGVAEAMRNLGLFGLSFAFEFRGKSSLKTVQGGIMTSIIVTVVTVIGLLFGKEVVEKHNPSVAMSEDFVPYAYIPLNEFPIVFSFINSSGNNLPDLSSLLEIKVMQMTVGANMTLISYYYNGLVPCNKTLFPKFEDIADTLINNSSFAAYCINHNNGLYFQNSASQWNSSYIELQVRRCRNSKCHPDMMSITENFFLNYRYINSIVDSSNFTNPVSYYIESKLIQVSAALSKRLTLSLRQNVLESDNGWILSDVFTFSFNSIAEIRFDANWNNTQIMAVGIESKNVKVRLNRSYLKVQELFAKIGGLFNALTIFASIISYNYRRFKYILFIIRNSEQLNHVMPDRSKKIDEVKINNLVGGEKDQVKNELSNTNLGLKLPNLLLNQDLACPQDIMDSKPNLSFFKYIFMDAFKQRESFKPLNDAIQTFEQNMSILSYLNMARDISRLKDAIGIIK